MKVTAAQAARPPLVDCMLIATYVVGLFSLFFFLLCVCLCKCVLGGQHLMGLRHSGSLPCVSVLVLLYVILIDYSSHAAIIV